MNFEKKKANISVDKLPKRLVSLDILRGVAIFGVILVHVSYKLFDASWLMDSFYSGNLSFSPFTWFLIVLLGYFGTWHGFFLFISAIVNSLTFSKKARMEHDMNKLLKKNVVGGVVIVFIGYLVEGLGYWGYFGTAIRSGDWSNFRPFLSENFWIQTLQIIGFALIINGFILFFLLKNEGYKKIKRNILIYVILIFLVLFSTPFLNDLISNNYIPGWPDIYVVSHYFNFKTMLLNIVIGPKFPLLPFLVSSSVIGILAQRLVRRICENCKEEIQPDEELIEQLNLSEYVKQGVKFYKGRGCQLCSNTGYKGRIGIFEIMIIDDEIRELIIDGSPVMEIRNRAHEKGMKYLFEDGLEKVLQGITTLDEVTRVCEENVEISGTPLKREPDLSAKREQEKPSPLRSIYLW